MKDIKHTLRILVIHFLSPNIDEEKALHTGEELESLIQTLGAAIVDRIIERHYKPEVSTYVGKITLRQIERRIKREKIDVVVLNAKIKPSQLHRIKLSLEDNGQRVEVWDRVDLILQIFDKHATTTEAKLQIKLARMRYMGFRIYGMGAVLSQQGGGIGTSGVGETNTELMKRHWRSEIKKITDEWEKIDKSRAAQLVKRKRSGFKTISLVGYTNAGKTSLFNQLTGKNTLVENALFTTLDSSIGKMYMQELQKEVLVTDTIGFIRNLPLELIKAFKSTLMESIHADILLHVIDVSDKEMQMKIDVVNKILAELGRNLEDMIYVFNKIDVGSFNKDDLKEKYEKHSPIFVSAKTGAGILEIKKYISKRFVLVPSITPS